MPVQVNIASSVRKAQTALDKGAKDKEIRAILQTRAEKTAKEYTKELKQEFDSHQVTKELKTKLAISSYLGGYGSLTAYFGLAADKVKEDLSRIKQLFNEYSIVIVKKQGTASYEVSIKYPNVQQFEAATPPPEGAYPISWLKAMENGLLQNFSHFLFPSKRKQLVGSRQGYGIQTEVALRPDARTVPAIPYVKSILSNVLKPRKLFEAIRRKF